MRIFIITMDDPLQSGNFIKQIIDNRVNDIIGLAVPKGDRLTLSKGKSKNAYILSLLLIMGPYYFVKNSIIHVWNKIKIAGHKYGLNADPTILGYASEKGIPVFRIKTPNSKVFREQLAAMKPDLIVLQSTNILKKEILEIPTIGIVNRHNALLPKNRGRLSPFWVLYKGEKETGVSIHFVEEKLDSGDIIVQEKFTVAMSDTFNTLVKKSYEIAPKAMLEALDLLENGFKEFIPNDDNKATYNTTPELKEAWEFRKKKWF